MLVYWLTQYQTRRQILAHEHAVAAVGALLLASVVVPLAGRRLPLARCLALAVFLAVVFVNPRLPIVDHFLVFANRKMLNIAFAGLLVGAINLGLVIRFWRPYVAGRGRDPDQ
jgi:hypothetical protein